MSLGYFTQPTRRIDKRLSPINEAHLTKLQSRVWVARLSSRLTQKELAKRAGVSRKTVQQIETEGCWPTLIVAMKLAKALNKPIEELFVLSK